MTLSLQLRCRHKLGWSVCPSKVFQASLIFASKIEPFQVKHLSVQTKLSKLDLTGSEFVRNKRASLFLLIESDIEKIVFESYKKQRKTNSNITKLILIVNFRCLICKTRLRKLVIKILCQMVQNTDNVNDGTTRFKNVNNCLNTDIYFYLETSGGQGSNLYLKVVKCFQHQCCLDICGSLRQLFSCIGV
jgi:hypothetical protein